MKTKRFSDDGRATSLVAVGLRRLSVIVAVAVLTNAGCARYRMGNATLFTPNVRTVYIPVVRNDTWRHGLEVQLTEAIIKAVETRTPYKVVSTPNADSTITCRLSSENKRTVVEAVTDEPRVIEALLSIELTWTDRLGNLLMTNRFVPDGEFAFFFMHGVDFVPEAGQSMATTQQRVIERLADQIVNQMESRW